MGKTQWQKQQQRKQGKAEAKTPTGGCPVCGAINCDRHQQQPSVKKSSSV